MPRFSPIVRIKEKTKSPLTENRRHLMSLVDEVCDAKPLMMQASIPPGFVAAIPAQLDKLSTTGCQRSHQPTQSLPRAACRKHPRFRSPDRGPGDPVILQSVE